MSLVAALAAMAGLPVAQAPRAAGAMLYEGARLIAGDGVAPIENAAFLVQNGRFVRVGRKGELQPPAGASRIDLTGKTVIPALVDAHSHIGYMKDLSPRARGGSRQAESGMDSRRFVQLT